jgi:hypothetical protein
LPEKRRPDTAVVDAILHLAREMPGKSVCPRGKIWHPGHRRHRLAPLEARLKKARLFSGMATLLKTMSSFVKTAGNEPDC